MKRGKYFEVSLFFWEKPLLGKSLDGQRIFLSHHLLPFLSRNKTSYNNFAYKEAAERKSEWEKTASLGTTTGGSGGATVHIGRSVGRAAVVCDDDTNLLGFRLRLFVILYYTCIYIYTSTYVSHTTNDSLWPERFPGGVVGVEGESTGRFVRAAEAD